MKGIIICTIFVLSGIWSLTGCKSVEYVPVETARTDSVYIRQLSRDSIYTHDSIYIHEKGDTVFQYRYRFQYKDRAVHDTAYIERRDSIRIPYPVEKRLTKWQQLKMDLGGKALVVGFILILIVFGRLIYKLRK